MPRKGSKDSVTSGQQSVSVSKSPRKSIIADKLSKSPDSVHDASTGVSLSRNRFRRLTTGSLYQPRGDARKSSDSDYHPLSRSPLDPISSLLGLDGSGPNYESDRADSALHSPSIMSRGRRVKRFVRSAPSGFGTDNYSTALGPLQEKHKLNPLERVFLEAAERGDKSTLARCLSFKEKVNVNCVNMLGRTAIQIAVDNENIELVELLLKQPGIKIGDALLYAIQEGVYRIVEMLIDHPSITKEMLGSAWTERVDFVSNTEEESHDFSADISPVILAAVCNQFEILQLLLNRGARIEEPHKSSCSCVKCHRLLNEDPLKHTLQRINTYRALASPAWISLTSPDPILTAFELSSELLHLASRENEFKETFISLCEQCRKYACDLLDLCRGTGEVVAVLSKSNFSDSEDSETEDENDGPLDDTGLVHHTNSSCNHQPCSGGHEPSAALGGNDIATSDLNRPEIHDWRALANRVNGTKRKHTKADMFYHRSVSSAQLRQGVSLESQHTVSDELGDEMIATSMLNLQKVGSCVKTTMDGSRYLHVPQSQHGHTVTIRDNRDPSQPRRSCRKQDLTGPSTSVTFNQTDSTSDDGITAGYSAATGARSTLFCEPRRIPNGLKTQKNAVVVPRAHNATVSVDQI
ncbi:unnamed protein product [Echinostoma caproni]|uniref:ANK_REP_REGION domain-containing protein n=1 Tax=Echinostoma caproni TaxID=27848 RepID=A0A183AB60_9TREM|nr:unnamed protein product [Echinostoma caproni]